MRHSHATRRGLTLIEMLIVMAVIVALLGLTAAVAPRLGDRQRASRGAAQLQAWLNIAKQRAIRSVAEGDPRPYGVRLVPPSGLFEAQYVRECLYIEAPTAFTGGSIMCPYDNDENYLPFPTPPNPTQDAPNRYKFVLLAGVELPTTGNAAVQPGDILDLYELFPNQPRRIVSVTPVANGSYPKYAFDHFRIELDAEVGATEIDYDATAPISPTCKQSRKPTYTYHASYNPPTVPMPVTTYPSTPPPVTAAYRIYRQPRPVPGEPVLLFPKDVGIDISRSSPVAGEPFVRWYRLFPSSVNTGGGGPFDIVFDPSGRVTGGIGFDPGSRWVAPTSSLGTSRICLWVRELSKDYTTGAMPEGDNSLITVYTRSGLVAAHPVETSRMIPNTAGNPNSWDPFYLTHTAQSSGQ